MIGLKLNANRKTTFSLQSKTHNPSVRFIQKYVKLILTTDFPELGIAGQEVVVKKGFGKNFLVPSQKAVYWTPEQRAAIPVPSDEKLKELEKQKLLKGAAKKFAAIKLQITTRNKDGNLKTALTPAVVVQKLWKQYFVELNPEQIEMPPISTAGKHVITIKMSGDSIPLDVVVKSV